MEKKNSLLLTIIAIAVLLVSVVGATFAYFASSNTIDATANLTATTSSAASFSSQAGSPINLNITGDLMMKSQASSDNEPEAANGSTTLTISLTASAGTTCTYDIGYVNTGDAYTAVVPDGGVAKNHSHEFEIEGSSSQSGDAQFALTTYQTISTGTESAPAMIIDNASITVPSGQTKAEDIIWTFTARFYNMNAPQATNKTYGGYFRVIDGSVLC